MHNNAMTIDKTLMKSASKTKAGLLKGTSIH